MPHLLVRIVPKLGGMVAHLSSLHRKLLEHQSRSWYIRWAIGELNRVGKENTTASVVLIGAHRT